jgi:hypothetical protein
MSLCDLVAFNGHQMNPAALYGVASNSSSSSSWYGRTSCIESSSSLIVNEDVLMNKAIAGTKQLLNELWKLPSEKVSGGFAVAKLPGRSKSDGYVLPRALVSREEWIGLLFASLLYLVVVSCVLLQFMFWF